MNRKVRVGSKYVYDPVMFDLLQAMDISPIRGQLVKVINLHGCPPANTMGMCYVIKEDLNQHNEKYGKFIFAGMVCTNSLINIVEWKRRQNVSQN